MKVFQTVINANALQDHLQNDRWLIIDTRFDLTDPDAGYNAYQEDHIPGAIYVDLHKDLSVFSAPSQGRHPLPAESELIQLFSRLGIHSEIQVVIYDSDSGAFAARLWWMLRYMGHKAVALLDGGWQKWQEDDFAIEREENTPLPSTFMGIAQKHLLVAISELSQAELLLDSRDPARYRGEFEPMDPIAGHIPGARNYFWKKNLDDEGYFWAPEKLKSMFLQAYADTQQEQVVFYCGSGVTACHNVLAATHAGLDMPRLYAGSWSEWCADPTRPVAIGEE